MGGFLEMPILGLHPRLWGNAWESALLIDSLADSYADEILKLLSQRWKSAAKMCG